MGEFGLSVHRSGGSICSGVVRRGVAQSGQRICFGRFEALPEGKREWPFLLPSVETEIEDWAFSLFYREAAGVNSVSSSSPCFLPASACALPQKEAHIVTIHRDSCLWLYSNWQRDNGLIPTPMGSDSCLYFILVKRKAYEPVSEINNAIPSHPFAPDGSTCPRVEEFDDWPSLQKIPELVDSESAGLEESGATRIFNGFESLLIPGGRPNSMEFAISQACRLSKERPVLGGYYSFLSIEPLSLIPLVQPSSRTCTIDATEIANSIIEKIRKGATIWHQISGGVERAAVRSGKTIKKRRLFVEVSTERPLGSGKRITITEHAIEDVARYVEEASVDCVRTKYESKGKVNDNLKPYLDQKNLYDIIIYSHSLEVWNPEYSVARVAGKEAMDQEKIRSVLDWEVPKKERSGSSGGERYDSFKENVDMPSVWSARLTKLAAEEIRRMNAAGGVQNRPAEDGRVHVVEPRAREALKKGGGDERLYSKSMPELDSAKMIIDAGSSDNIASTEMQTRLLPSELAKEKGVGITFLDMEEESIECYALRAKLTSRAEDREQTVLQAEKEGYFSAFNLVVEMKIYSTVDAFTQLNEMWIAIKNATTGANPLALLTAAQPYSDNYYQAPKPQRSNATSSFTRPNASTRHNGKEIVKPVTPQSDQYFKSPTNLRNKKQPSNFFKLRNKTEDTTPRMGYSALTARDLTTMQRNAGSQSGLKTNENHKEKMMMCKQPNKCSTTRQAEQADWLADTDEEIENRN
ncbi:hypothetical protein Tco_0180721 [Tanacetum coccineum]